MDHQTPKSPPLPRALRHRLGAALGWAAQSAQEMADRSLKPLGLGMSHFAVMTLLRNLEPGEALSQQTIGERMRIDRTTMVGLIDDLERLGYAKRERNPDDRRAYVISLTATGRRAQKRAEETIDSEALAFFGRLSEPERKELHRLLRRLIDDPE